MQKFFSSIFSKKGSSSKRSSFRGSQASIAGSRNAQAGSSLASSMRGAASLDNLSSYRVDPKRLSKFKLHKASWEGDLNKVESLARPNQIDLRNEQQQVRRNFVEIFVLQPMSFALDATALRRRQWPVESSSASRTRRRQVKRRR